MDSLDIEAIIAMVIGLLIYGFGTYCVIRDIIRRNRDIGDN